jgi:large subunit ribosomal protein L37Ae
MRFNVCWWIMRTKKVGASGKYGVRYGKRIKDRWLAVNIVQKQKHKCPRCMKPSLKRQSAGIWSCHKCGLKIAGKAYKPS